MKVQRKSLSSVALGVILTGVAAFAQTSPAPAPVVSSFLVESVVPLTNIASVSQPVFPSGVVSGLQSNSLELRQQIKYTASTQTANVKGLIVQTGAPLPTPDNSGGATVVWSYVVQVDRAFVTSKRGIVLTGSVLSNTGGSPFGDLTGNEVVISGSFMLPVDPAPVANTAYTAVSVNVVGVANLFGKQGYGNISLLASGTNPQAPVANAGKRVVTAKNVVQLSAAGSSDPMGGALTYSWKFIPIYGQTANITGADTANPVVTLPDYSDAVGDYTFQLTVTNQAGLSSTDTVIVTYDPSTGTSGQ